MKKMRRLPLYLSVAILTFFIGIAVATVLLIPHFKSSYKAVTPAVIKSTNTQKIIDCSKWQNPLQRDGSSSINKSGKSKWEWKETRVEGKENLVIVQFLNANEGWAGGSKGALYKTIDAGRTWQKIKLDIPADSYVNSISFANPSVGWIVASQPGDEFKDINSLKSWILSTTDGGNSWQQQYFGKALELSRIQFINEYEGWAVGAKNIQYQYVGFIIHTTDGGKNWTNISKSVSEKEGGNGGSIVNIYAEEPSKALILKFRRSFYSTTDSGQSWQRVVNLPEEPPQSLLGASGFGVLGNNRMWAAGGADSIEGMWGTLARMDDCSWTLYTIGGVYFADAVFLSDNDVIVCGTIPTPGHEMPWSERDGLILDSSDGGLSWTIAYRNSHVPHLNSLAVADSKNVWAVGEKGCILHLQPAFNHPE